MGPHASRIDAFHQTGVLVDQPRFPQHVRRGVLQLQQSGPFLSIHSVSADSCQRIVDTLLKISLSLF